LSMTGPFVAHETLLQCPKYQTVFDSDQLRRIVPSRCNTAYDVLVFVGRALFQQYRPTCEIQAELADRNIFISAPEVHYLGRKFILLPAQAHRLATPRIRSKMIFAGGYILHIDAMHEGDAPALMTGMDSLSEIILSNMKVPSENAESTSPFLQNLKKEYGTPIACVHDMGNGICRAVADVFPGVHDYICHFHFLRDIGKDFLEPAYQVLRNCLRHHAASSHLHAIAREARKELSEQSDESALVAKTFKENLSVDSALLPQASVYMAALWIIQGKKAGDGYGFPFDRPLLEFAERLFLVNGQMSKIRLLCDPEKSNPLFGKPAKHLSKIASDPRLYMAIEELRWRSRIFDSLRGAMRIASPEGHKGLNDEGSPEAMSTIRQRVTDFYRQIEENIELASDSLTAKMLAQLDKYDGKLFADPIDVNTPTGTVKIYPQRTNNILERFFRSMRRGYRRKTGDNAMRRALQAMLAETPLVKNLDNPDYMRILLNGTSGLEELFAEMDGKPPFPNEKSSGNTDRILPEFRSLINLPNLPEKLTMASLNMPGMAKSN